MTMFNQASILETLNSTGVFCFTTWFFDQNRSEFRIREKGHSTLEPYHSYFMTKPLHRIAGLTHFSLLSGYAACLEFVVSSRDEEKASDQSKNYSTQYCIAAYQSDIKSIYQNINRIVQGATIAPINVYFSPLDPILKTISQDVFKKNDFILLNLSDIFPKGGKIPYRITKLEEVCHEWMAATLDRSLFPVPDLQGRPELFTWFEQGEIYAVVLPGAFYQHDLQIFRNHSDFLINKIIPQAKRIGNPVPAASVLCGNYHTDGEMLNFCKEI